MNRVWIALAMAVVGSTALGCSPSTVGDPCTPEAEFVLNSAGSEPSVFRVDLNSVQCDTRVCMTHYFRGRVSCPYGNASDATGRAAGACYEVPGYRGLFTNTGDPSGALCCPKLGVPTGGEPDSPDGNTLAATVPAQCSKRTAQDAVYCTCRCDVPSQDASGNPIDKSQISLCSCPSGFSCVNLCDEQHGNCSTLPVGKWGSYCVKDASKGDDDYSKVQVDCSDTSDGLTHP
jgi:hypothetical protein